MVDARVSETAAIGVPDEIKGEAIVCFAVLRSGYAGSEEVERELIGTVVKGLGKTLRPARVPFVPALPPT